MNNIYGEKNKTIHTQTKAKVTILSSNTFFILFNDLSSKQKKVVLSINFYITTLGKKKVTQTNSQLLFL